MQVERVLRLLHLNLGHQAFHLVPQLLQLDVEVNLVLRAGELGAARAGGRHQVADLRGVKYAVSVLVVHSERDGGAFSTYRFSFWDFVRLQAKVEILCLHPEGFFAEDFVNA